MLQIQEIYTVKEYTEHERIIGIKHTNLLKCCDIG
jgi:hypothetical protein